MDQERNVIEKIVNRMYNFFDKPVTLFREKIVEPNQQHYPWYHQNFRRVPTIDQCSTEDIACQVEADLQLLRDKMVDEEIVSILRTRAEHCRAYHGYDDNHVCKHLQEIYEENLTNYFSKYGDMGPVPKAKHALMKQKHRMVWERRHGPIGSGMREEI